MHVFIVTNGPGELMGWVRPVIRSLKKINPSLKIVMVIPPCQYATGMEVNLAKSFLGVEDVVGATAYLKYLILGIPSFPVHQIKAGIVVFLGGDPIHALLLSKRLGLSAIAYIQKPRWKKHFKKFMVLNQKVKEEFLSKGIKTDRIIVVGDLTMDAVQLQMSKDEICNYWHLNLQEPIISIMPGSRPQQVKYITPFFLKVAELVKGEFPSAQFFIILSPFIAKENLTSLSKGRLNKVFEGTMVKLIREDKWKLFTETGLKISLVEKERYEMMSTSDIAITIPGTNTAELAFLGIPMVTVAPLNKPEAIPMDGLAGLIGKVPFWGTFIKRWIVKKYNKNIRFTAIPNIRAGEEIVPEVRGVIEAQDVAKEVISLLGEPSKRALISCKLKEAMEIKGAADMMAKVILSEVSPTK